MATSRATQGDAITSQNTALWGVRETAAFLGIPERGIYKHVSKGELPCIRVGSRLRFAPADLDRWLSQRRQGQV